MRARLLSVVGAQAKDYVVSDKPSDILPFRGNFPILENWERQDYFEAIESHEKVEDLSERFQKVTQQGIQMYNLETGFKNYLRQNNIEIDAFLKKSKEDKADWLAAWLNADCVDFSSLTIK